MNSKRRQLSDVNTEYDVVVVGGGVSGLTAGAILAKAGLSILVLERDSRPGGYLAGFRRKSFRFDSAIHWLNQYGKYGMGTKIFNFIGTDFPKPLPQHKIRRLKSDTVDYLLTSNPNELKEQLINDFPEDKKGIQKFFKDAEQLSDFFKVYPEMIRTLETMNFFEKIMLRLKQAWYGWPFVKHIRFHGKEGVERGLKRYFKSPLIRSLFRAEEDILGCLIPIAWAYNDDFQNPPIGGSMVFPEWLSHVIDFFGGHILLSAQVNEIDLEDGAVKGVKFDFRGKEGYVRTKHVIAACDVETLYEKMLPPDAISRDLKSRLKKADLYKSSATVSLTLDCPAEDLGFDEEMLFLMDDTIGRDDHTSGDPETGMISIIAPSLRDKSLAPEGTGTLTIYLAATIDYGDYWKTERDEQGNYIRGEAYKKFKSEYAEIVIDRVERKQAPGLRKHITYIDVATPVTHWRYTGNKDGSIMGALPGEKNMKMKLAHHQTQVKGLVLSGHWSDYGGGVPIAVKTAANSCLIVLKKLRPSAFKSLANYMDGKIPLKNQMEGFLEYDNTWTQELTPAEKKERVVED